MVSSPIELFYQLPGALSGGTGTDFLSSSTPVTGSGVVLQQCHRGVLPEESRRDEVFVSQLVRPADPPLRRGPCHRPLAPVRSGVSECPGQFSQPLQSGSGSGVDSLSGGGVRSHAEVAGYNRPFRHSPQPQVSSLLFFGGRPHVHRDGCHVATLGHLGSLYLSSLWHGASSSPQGLQECQLHHDSHNSI